MSVWGSRRHAALMYICCSSLSEMLTVLSSHPELLSPETHSEYFCYNFNASKLKARINVKSICWLVLILAVESIKYPQKSN